MWMYRSSTGSLLASDGELQAVGYSGHGAGLNNPSAEMEPDIGPIPRGEYLIGAFFTDPEKGPIVAHLTPIPGTNVFGRSGFMIHGDNSAGNESASLGCIILPHPARAAIQASGDYSLKVV